MIVANPGATSQGAAAALDALFHPRTIALVGAGAQSQSMGSRYARMLREFGFGGELFALNRAGAACGEIPGFARLADVPAAVDLALIAVPAAHVAGVLTDCAAARVPVAQVLTSFGPGEESPAGLLRAAGGVTRIVGPNCLGTYCARSRTTFVRDASPALGSVSIVSQSGGLSADILHQSRLRGLALSKVVSIGDCVDLDAADFIAYLGDDAETGAIGLYLEGACDRRLFELLRTVARRVPVVVLKGGRSAAGAASVASHTGALAGDYRIWQAAIEQAGALEAESVDDLLAMLTALQRGVPLPRGARVALAGNGGGMTVLATDALAARGMRVPQLEPSTVAAIDALQLPAGSSIGTALDFPVGALNKIEPSTLSAAFAALVADPGVDALLAHFNLSPFVNYVDADGIAASLGAALASIQRPDIPVYVALRGSPDARVESLRQRILEPCGAAGLPCFAGAGEAVRALAAARSRAGFLEVASTEAESAAPPDSSRSPGLPALRATFERASAEGREFLTQMEGFAVLDALGIAHPPVAFAASADEAARAAESLGFPVALKIESAQIVHKTEAGGVRLGLASGPEVRAAFEAIVASARGYDAAAHVDGVVVQAMAPAGPVLEAIVGIRRDASLGPIVLCGIGGTLVELFDDVAVRVAPVAPGTARRMWASLRAQPLLAGVRGGPAADVPELERIVLTVAAAAAALPEICELDLNPILAYAPGALAVDVRIRIS